MREADFQSDLIDELEALFPGCIVLKNDSTYLQGFPDLTILYGPHYAVLECKRSENEPHQPNQDYYIEYVDEMSFARFIFPENKGEVLSALQQAFRPRGSARFSKR